MKLKTIAEIKASGYEVDKIIINANLTEAEAYAAEAALINILNYISDIGLTNIVAGHHSADKVYKEFMLYAIGRNINKFHRFLKNELRKFEGKQEAKAA